MKNINLKTTLPFTMTIFTLVALAIGIPTLIIFTLGSDAGKTSDGLRFMIANDGRSVTITGYKKKAETIVIPGKIWGFPVRSIGFEAFDHCTSLTSIIIPSSVTSVGEFAFYRCYSLASVTLSRQTKVGQNAFHGLTKKDYRD